jgi:anti-anti-sigma factor
LISTELNIGRRDGYSVVALRGELDLSDAGYVGAALSAVAGRETWIILDLTGLAFIDTSGAAELASCREQARDAGGDLLIAASQPQVVRMLSWPVPGAGFRVYASPEEAVAALHEGITELVLSHLQVDPADVDWAGQLRAAARRLRRLALVHPDVVPMLLSRPPAMALGLRPPGVLRPLENILELLTRGGFSGADALHICRAWFGFVYGHILSGRRTVNTAPPSW